MADHRKGGGGGGLPPPGPLSRSISFGHSAGDIPHSHLNGDTAVPSNSSSRLLPATAAAAAAADNSLGAPGATGSLPPQILPFRGADASSGVGAPASYLLSPMNSAQNHRRVVQRPGVPAALNGRYDPATFYTGQNETPSLVGPGVLEAACRSTGNPALPASASSTGVGITAEVQEQRRRRQLHEQQQQQRGSSMLYPCNSLPRNYTLSDSFAPNSETTV